MGKRNQQMRLPKSTSMRGVAAASAGVGRSAAQHLPVSGCVRGKRAVLLPAIAVGSDFRPRRVSAPLRKREMGKPAPVE